MPPVLNRPHRPPPPGIAVRSAEASDLPALFALFREPQVQADLLTRSAFTDLDEFTCWFGGIAPAQRLEVVAICDSHLVGFVGLYPQLDHMSHTGTLMLAVSDHATRRGIGAFLLQTAILSGFFVAGLGKIALSVFTDNAPAVALYRAAGFEIEGVLRRFARREGQSRDVYAMGLLLE